MARRGNSEGSIRKRSDGRWEARIILPDGGRKSLYGKTRQEVIRLLAQATRDREQGLAALTERQFAGTYLMSWLEHVRHDVEPSSYQKYQRVVRTCLLPGLQAKQLSKLTAQQTQAFNANCLKAGKGVSYVRNANVVLHAALESAVRLGLVYRNVTDIVDVPRLRRREMMPLTEEQ